MAIKKWNEKQIAEMQKEGIGKGTGKDYRPWLTVQSISSVGRSRRMWSDKTKRQHDLLSDVEHDLFLCLEHANDIVDIREQFPLDRQLTRAVAEELKIAHPFYPGTQVPTVMTVDFMVTRINHGKKILEAFNAKTAEEAEDTRSLEKLEIQREVCSQLGITHHLIYDALIPNPTAANISWLRTALPKPDEPDFRPGYLEELALRMENDISNFQAQLTLQMYCSDFDVRLGLKPGVGLRVARILMYNRILKPNLQCPDLSAARRSEFTMTGSQGALRIMGEKK